MEKSIYDLQPNEVDPELEDLKSQLQSLNSQYFSLKEQHSQEGNFYESEEAQIIKKLTEDLNNTKQEMSMIKQEIEQSIGLTKELIGMVKTDIITNKQKAATIQPEVAKPIQPAKPVEDVSPFVEIQQQQLDNSSSIEELVSQIQSSVTLEDEIIETPKSITETRNITEIIDEHTRPIQLTDEQLAKIDHEISKTIQNIKLDIDEHKTKPINKREVSNSGNTMFGVIIVVLSIITVLLISMLTGM